MKLKDLTKEVSNNGEMILKLQGELPTTDNVIQLCLYKNGIQLCKNRSPSILNWDEHREYELFSWLLLIEGTNDIINFKNSSFSYTF